MCKFRLLGCCKTRVAHTLTVDSVVLLLHGCKEVELRLRLAGLKYWFQRAFGNNICWIAAPCWKTTVCKPVLALGVPNGATECKNEV
eukprot:1500829-Amphidinium_carterae.1